MTEKIKLLIVDDEIHIIKAFKRNLEILGFDVTIATGGWQAYELFKESSFDAVVSDIRMPKGDGIELLKNIKSLDPFAPVVSFVSGYSDITVPMAYDLGAEGIFAKPFDIEKLAEKIKDCILPEEKRWIKKISEEVHQLPPTSQVLWGRGGFSACFTNIDSLTEENHVYFTLDKAGFDQIITGQGKVCWLDKGKGLGGIEICYIDEVVRDELAQQIRKEKVIPYIPNIL